MSASPLVSVCVLSARPAALALCLTSLREQVKPPPFEVLIGGRSPSADVLREVRRLFPGAPVCDIGARHPGEARNPLIERARGQLLLFLDDDVTAPSNLLHNLATVAAEHPEVAVFGGPNETPLRSSRFQVIQGAVLSSVVGAGPVCRRYGPRPAALVDERWFTLCNLAVRRGTMLPFLENLVGGEENALLNELGARGHRMLYEPHLRAFHERRGTSRSFAVQMEKYGRGRGELLRRQPSSTRLAYLVPSALLAYLALLPAALVLFAHRVLALVPLLVYLLLVLLSASRIAWTLRRSAAAPVAGILTFVVHLFYGIGVLRGLTLGSRGRTHAPIRWLVPANEDPG